MSIVHDRAERDAAAERLQTKTEEQLAQDLAYWAVKAREHVAEYRTLNDKRALAGELYAEAEHWQLLIAEELTARAARARGTG